MTFDDLKFGPHSAKWQNGVQAIVFFENGYGASVIRGEYSYGGRDGLYELAVLKTDEDGWDLCYDSGLMEDVEGYLTPEDVTSWLNRIEALA